MLYTAIAWMVFGLIIGVIAWLFVLGEQPLGPLGTIVVGIVGAYIGGFLASLLFAGELSPATFSGWIGSLIGTIVLLGVYKATTMGTAA